MVTTEVLDCGHAPSQHESFTSGFGVMDGKRYCYDCIAKMDRQTMMETGTSESLPLYLVDNNKVTNWPASLSFPLYGSARKGKHNIAGSRYDFDFIGPDGFIWHGAVVGEWTQIAHCKRTKVRYSKAS